ncbi:hypothetical protein [Sneathiella limimaris]|uniref:hypothetical protein n=1 Tax=Sneathiella limimaris TaxID=1964213 RepID=UPI00146E9C47|nr:hypothetical protein [Sneathiella limimaris]
MTLIKGKFLARLECMSLPGMIYLATYSVLEAFHSDMFWAWTEYCRELSHALAGGFPGVNQMIHGIVALGYDERVPYFEHMTAAIVIFCLAVPVLNIVNYNYIRIASKERVKNIVIISRYIAIPLISIFGIIAYFYIGIYPEKHSFKSFQPHLSNIDVFLFSFTLILLFNHGFYNLVIGILRLYRYMRPA